MIIDSYHTIGLHIEILINILVYRSVIQYKSSISKRLLKIFDITSYYSIEWTRIEFSY